MNKKFFGSIILLSLTMFTITADSLDNFAQALQDISASKEEKTPIKKVDVQKEYSADEIKTMIQHSIDKPDDKENFRKLNEAFKSDADFDSQKIFSTSMGKLPINTYDSVLSIVLRSFEFGKIKKLLQRLEINPNTYANTYAPERAFSATDSGILGRMATRHLWWLNGVFVKDKGTNAPNKMERDEKDAIVNFLLTQESIDPNAYIIIFSYREGKSARTPLAAVIGETSENDFLKKLLQHPKTRLADIWVHNNMKPLSAIDISEIPVLQDKQVQSYVKIITAYEDARKNKQLKEFLETYATALDDEMEIVFRRAVGLYDQDMLILLNQKDPQKYSNLHALLYAMSVNQAASIPWLLAKLTISKDDLVYILGLKEFVQQKDEQKGQKGFESKLLKERQQKLDPIKQAYAQAKEDNFKAVGRAFENYRGTLNLPVPEEVIKEFIIPGVQYS